MQVDRMLIKRYAGCLISLSRLSMYRSVLGARTGSQEVGAVLRVGVLRIGSMAILLNYHCPLPPEEGSILKSILSMV